MTDQPLYDDGFDEHLRVLAAYIRRNPNRARAVITVATNALDQWALAVRAATNKAAYIGILGAVGLPPYKAEGWLDINTEGHRTCARLTAIGMNLHNRRWAGLSRVERDLLAFVEQADAFGNLDGVLDHYEALLGERALPNYPQPPPAEPA